MKFSLTALLTASLLAGEALAAPAAIYENYGEVTVPPQIDAIAFANYGDFSVFTSLPFDFQNTLYFTNRGTISGSPGFRFANGATVGAFTPAKTFLNDVGGTITAEDGFTFSVGPSFGRSSANPSYVLISADTIINRGYLLAGGGGLVQITGKNVDLSRSGLGIGGLELTSTHFVTDSNYYPDPGIYDDYWALTNQTDMQPAGLLNITATATNATSPVHDVTNNPTFAFPFPMQLSVSITNPAYGIVSALTNAGGADPETGRVTNIYRQAVFVAVSDTNLVMDIKWARGPIVTNPFQTAIVEVGLSSTNIVTGNPELSTLYVMDRTASWTNFVVLTNLSVLPPETLRPATIELTRTPPREFFTGADGNSSLTNTFFFNSRDTNFVPVVTNIYAAYSAVVDSLASRPPNVPGLEITDYPGRVEINADNLDLTRARLRGSGLVSVKTTNLLASRGVIVDSENVNYNLATTNGLLSLQGIASDRVVRLNGTLSLWSGVWTNFMGTMATNQVDDGSGNMTNVVTNLVTEIDYHMLIVDATGLQGTKPVTTYDFISHANDVVLSDPLTVVRSFLVDAQTLTLNSRLSLSTKVTNWVSTNTPRLKSWTSKGTVDVQNLAVLGYDTAAGYTNFANRGFLGANGIRIKSEAFENSGTITSRVDGIVVSSKTAQFQDASTLSAGDLYIAAGDMRFTASTNATRGKLVITATNSLSDTGDGANNYFTCHSGFELPIKPTFGDLLGTTLETIAPRYARVEHVWAGEDRGASATGFQDNVAIGRLVLGGDRQVLLSFRGAGAKNGLYVDYLELTGPLTNAIENGDLGEALVVNTNLTIYFADSNVAADQLEELSGGRLLHVNFVGGESYVEVPVRSTGAAVRMERAIRQSTVLDSDGDGIANAYDAYPLDFDSGLSLSGVRGGGASGILLSWVAQPQTTYQIEYATSVVAPVWQPLTTYTSSAAVPQTATIEDALSANHPQRYYRLRLSQ